MNYELAKQLKDAGFPVKSYRPAADIFNGDFVEPTLSELIEACGEDFNDLSRWKKGNEIGDWNALAVNTKGNEWGSTAEEAVANLWLALQDDKVKV